MTGSRGRETCWHDVPGLSPAASVTSKIYFAEAAQWSTQRVSVLQLCGSQWRMCSEELAVGYGQQVREMALAEQKEGSMSFGPKLCLILLRDREGLRCV